MQVDFERLVAQTEAVRRQSTARDARREALAQQRLSEVHAEIAGKQITQFITVYTNTDFILHSDQKYDIESCLKEMESCFDILVPRFFPEEEECLPLQRTPTGETLAEAGSEKAEFRGRVLSSGGSFASLESGEGSEGEGKGEEGEDDAGKEEGNEGEMGAEDEGEVGEEGGSDESDVEWEEVDPLPGPSSLKENGFVYRGTSISIQLPTKVSAIVIFNDVMVMSLDSGRGDGGQYECVDCSV